MNKGDTKTIRSDYSKIINNYGNLIEQNKLYIIKSNTGTILSYFINGKTVTTTNYYNSSASYLSILPENNNDVGNILAIAGAGGSAPSNSSSYFGLGGGDAGYIFKPNGVAPGF